MMNGTIGPYRILSKLGAGGMGEVYRAHDSKLNRDVAIKVLPEAVANDPERLARLHREAQVLASLNHPNIAAIYGIEDSKDTHGLVMELIEGPTLADVIAAGTTDVASGLTNVASGFSRTSKGLPVDQALPIAKQIAEALEAAHERGIIHRDLKPANVKVREDGTVKVLDFGLAKAIEPGLGQAGGLTQLPTMTSPAITEAGMILGTAAYMSPEQARGHGVDKRTDIWAFGCLLYEMLTGRLAFPGPTRSDIVAGVLTAEPDWAALPATAPLAVRRLLRRCLQKDVRQRLRDIGDARFDLASADAAEYQEGSAAHRFDWRMIAVAVALILGGAVIGRVVGNAGRQASLPGLQPVARFTLLPPAGQTLLVSQGTPHLAISPDARYVAFETEHAAQNWLYLRDLVTGGTRLISQASVGYPFFSPDSVWLGFFETGKLDKVPVRGGEPIPLANAPLPRGGSWGTDGVIVFAPDARASLSQVTAEGGPVRAVTTLDGTRGETSHRDPEVLPGGRAIVYRAEGTTYANGALVVFSRDTGQERVLVAEGGSDPRYSPTGHLLYRQGGNLMAVPFDPVRLETTGTPAAVAEDVQTFAVSNSGTLVYEAGRPAAVTLAWVDRRGRAESLPLAPRNMSFPRLTVDDRRVAVGVQERLQRDIWTYDVQRGILSRLTNDGANGWPVWTPDARQILYASNRPRTVWDVLSKASDGSGQARPLVVQPLSQIPRDVSPDGEWMAYQDSGSDTGVDIWLFPLQRHGPARPFARTRATERWPAFSPDSRWIAYTSNESGRDEIYVRSVDGTGGKWQISNGGGVEPRWNPAGRELFYRAGGKMLAVDVTTGTAFSAGTPHVLFEDVSYPLGGTGTNYDVAHDGTRFLMLKDSSQLGTQSLNVVTNWFEELKRLVPPTAK